MNQMKTFRQTSCLVALFVVGLVANLAQVQAGYQYGGVSSHVPGQTFGLHEQKRFAASAGWALGLSTFGQAKTAKAGERSLNVMRWSLLPF